MPILRSFIQTPDHEWHFPKSNTSHNENRIIKRQISKILKTAVNANWGENMQTLKYIKRCWNNTVRWYDLYKASRRSIIILAHWFSAKVGHYENIYLFSQTEKEFLVCKPTVNFHLLRKIQMCRGGSRLRKIKESLLCNSLNANV